MFRFRSHLPHPVSSPLIAVLVLLLGLCLSVSSADCRESGPADHCGALAHMGHEGHHESADARVSEDHHGTGHALHAATPESCPVDPSSTGSGHKCSHHRASGADADQPSLYCNCHAKHTDGRTAHSVQENSGLTPRITSIAPAVPYLSSPSQAEGFLQAVFLDPVEKPPTRS